MSREAKQATRESQAGTPMGGYRETHPAYGAIGAHRVTSTGHYLHGSDFRHHNFITVTIHTAEMQRSDINTEYHHARRQVIEVAMSEAQWATFVSTPNQGSGVPCTIEYVSVPAAQSIEADEYGQVPAILPIETRREQYKLEVDERLQAALDMLDGLVAEIEAASLSQKVKKELIWKAQAAKSQLTSGLPWVAEQYAEHGEKTVERSKIEVEAYLTSAIQRAGLQALGAPVQPPIEMIEETTHD